MQQEALKVVNQLVYSSERRLGNETGLPRRDWFEHQIYAPGFYTGYGVKTLPQIREGLEEGQWDEAKEGVTKVAAAINAPGRAGRSRHRRTGPRRPLIAADALPAAIVQPRYRQGHLSRRVSAARVPAAQDGREG